jgi:hypothetical protein
MTLKQVEEKLTELVHRQPFMPFVVEMIDGTSLIVPHEGVAFDDTGAVFISPDGPLVSFEFKTVRAIRLMNSEAVA